MGLFRWRFSVQTVPITKQSKTVYLLLLEEILFYKSMVFIESISGGDKCGGAGPGF